MATRPAARGPGTAGSGASNSQSAVVAQVPPESSGESAVQALDAGAASPAPSEPTPSASAESVAAGEFPADLVQSETPEYKAAEEPVTAPVPAGEAPRLPDEEDPGPAPAGADA